MNQEIPTGWIKWYWLDILDVDIFMYKLVQILYDLALKKSYAHYILA
jgi:hypothetical protein